MPERAIHPTLGLCTILAQDGMDVRVRSASGTEWVKADTLTPDTSIRTDADLRSKLRAIGFAFAKVDGEYRVHPVGGCKGKDGHDSCSCFFADDRNDAYGTALAEAQRSGAFSPVERARHDERVAAVAEYERVRQATFEDGGTC